MACGLSSSKAFSRLRKTTTVRQWLVWVNSVLSAVLMPQMKPNTCGWNGPTHHCNCASTILSCVLAVQLKRDTYLSLVSFGMVHMSAPTAVSRPHLLACSSSCREKGWSVASASSIAFLTASSWCGCSCYWMCCVQGGSWSLEPRVVESLSVSCCGYVWVSGWCRTAPEDVLTLLPQLA